MGTFTTQRRGSTGTAYPLSVAKPRIERGASGPVREGRAGGRRVVLRFAMDTRTSGRKFSRRPGGPVELLPGLAGCNGAIAPILVSVPRK